MSQKRARKLRSLERRIASLEGAVETRSRSPTAPAAIQINPLKRFLRRFFNCKKEC